MNNAIVADWLLAEATNNRTNISLISEYVCISGRGTFKVQLILSYKSSCKHRSWELRVKQPMLMVMRHRVAYVYGNETHIHVADSLCPVVVHVHSTKTA